MGQFIFVSLGLLVMAFSLTGAQKSCLKGWYFRNHGCNKLFEEQKNWNDAKAFCQKQGPGCHLASIRSKTQRDDMADYVAENIKSSQSVWIGLHDPHKKDEWQWINSSRFSYLAWADDKPERSKNNKFCAKLEKETKEPEPLPQLANVAPLSLQKGQWEWAGRSRTNYIAWAVDESDDSEEYDYCVQLNKKYSHWKTSDCEELYPFLCQCR